MRKIFLKIFVLLFGSVKLYTYLCVVDNKRHNIMIKNHTFKGDELTIHEQGNGVIVLDKNYAKELARDIIKQWGFSYEEILDLSDLHFDKSEYINHENEKLFFQNGAAYGYKLAMTK